MSGKSEMVRYCCLFACC